MNTKKKIYIANSPDEQYIGTKAELAKIFNKSEYTITDSLKCDRAIIVGKKRFWIDVLHDGWQ
ncbi:MAG: hypothetical protein MJ174_07525 [Treponema sp.]|nr:hypothetical protein [Treponema sp.]